jgi:RNA polymerase sigma-70 factor (ECF subfamily)
MGNDDTEKDDALADINPAIVRSLAEAHDSIRQFLRRALRDDAEADDVMQEFYLRVLTRSSQIKREESARAWLRRVLRSVLNDHFRRQAARRRAEADFARKEAAIPPTEADFDTVACLCLYKVLPALKPEYAEVLRRVDLAEESREAVATVLGLTAGNLTVRLHRARRALQRVLELTCETCPIHGYLDCGCEYTRKLGSVRLHATRRTSGV